MITMLATRAHRYTISSFAGRFAGRVGRSISAVSYDDVLARARLQPGTYVFCDLERLAPAELDAAGGLYAELQASPGRYRVLNDPRRHLDRVQLSSRLRQAGINDFAVRPLAAWESEPRYPVFVRQGGHRGGASELLPDRDALEAAVSELAPEAPEPDVLVVEFLDTRGADGLYRKYGVFRIGDRWVRRHLFLSTEWMVKDPIVGSWRSALEEHRFLIEDSCPEGIARVFELAGVDYGRIDFAYHDGRLQVWEINTNPMIMSRRSFTGRNWLRTPGQLMVRGRLIAAFRELAR